MTQTDHNGASAQIQKLVDEVRSADTEIEALETKLSELKAQKRTLQEITIPDVMTEHGMSAITLFSGIRVELKPFYYARLPKETSRLEQFFAWLRDNGFGALVKSKFEIFTTDAEETKALVDFFAECNIPYDLNESIHWKTLEAWYKEQYEHAVSLPELLFDHYTGRKANIK